MDIIDRLYKSGDPAKIALADKSIRDNRKVTKKALRGMDIMLYVFATFALFLALYIFS